MKRAAGSGTVYRRTDWQSRHRPWCALVSIGYSADGRRLKKYIGSFATRAEAQRALEIYNTKLPQGQKAYKITFGQVWDRVVTERGPRMNRNYLSVWKNHMSVLARIPIGEIKAWHLQEVVERSGLSGGAQQRLLTMYHWIYELALANDIVVKDYSRFVHTAPKVQSTKHHPFTEDEMRLLWSRTDNDIVKIILIQTYTGMRPAELGGLLNQNVHLEERYMIGGIKTKAGINRTIPIADCILPFIRYFRQIALFRHADTLLVSDPSAGLYSKGGKVDVSKLYSKMLPAIGITGHSGHDARHTFVSLADNYGINPVILKLIVGHAQSGDVTKDVYTHKVLPQLISAVNSLPHGPVMRMYPEAAPAKLVPKW